MRWAGHVARMGYMRNSDRSLIVKISGDYSGWEAYA